MWTFDSWAYNAWFAKGVFELCIFSLKAHVKKTSQLYSGINIL